MSRLGKIALPVPSGVSLTAEGSTVSAKGPKGELSISLVDSVTVDVRPDSVLVNRSGDGRHERSAQGLVRRLVANMIEGVNTGFSKTLQIVGLHIGHKSLGY